MADCQAVNNRSKCICHDGFDPDVLVNGCSKEECRRHRDCANRGSCVRLQCGDPCQEAVCGQGASCEAVNHRAVCRCSKGYTGAPGDPSVGCRKIDGEYLCNPNSWVTQCAGVLLNTGAIPW